MWIILKCGMKVEAVLNVKRWGCLALCVCGTMPYFILCPWKFSNLSCNSVAVAYWLVKTSSVEAFHWNSPVHDSWFWQAYLKNIGPIQKDFSKLLAIFLRVLKICMYTTQAVYMFLLFMSQEMKLCDNWTICMLYA